MVETLGADAYLYGTARIGGGDADVIARIGGRDRVQMGDTVHVTADADAIHLFDKALARGSTNDQAARQDWAPRVARVQSSARF